MTIVIMDAAMHSITDQTSSESDGAGKKTSFIQNCRTAQIEHRQKAPLVAHKTIIIDTEKEKITDQTASEGAGGGTQPKPWEEGCKRVTHDTSSDLPTRCGELTAVTHRAKLLSCVLSTYVR